MADAKTTRVPAISRYGDISQNFRFSTSASTKPKIGKRYEKKRKDFGVKMRSFEMAKKRSFEMACGVAEFDLKKRRNSAKSGGVGSSD